MKLRPALLCLPLLLSACKPSAVRVIPPDASPTPAPSASASPTASPTPTPVPVPTPTPVPVLPRKPVEMGKLFNGVTFTTKFATPETDELASLARNQDASYEVQITFTAKLPRASTSLDDLNANDPKLAETLIQMPKLVETAKVSPFFEKLYKIKVATLRDQLFALDAVLTRHNFYDCETVLELQAPETSRKALMIIGDMDVNVDGSDGDRNIEVDDSGRFFQPQTSYRWAKTTEHVNPLIARTQERVAEWKAELAKPGIANARAQELREAIQHGTRTVSDLKSFSFLVSAADPTIVVPSFMLKETGPYAPSIGDYAVVIYDGVVYPAIVGDAGPSAKVGEASLRLARQINPKASANSRSVSNIKVAYMIFPGTAEKAERPDLAKWREKCQQFVGELGGAKPELFVWEDIVPPWPTPTPTPTPPPTPTPEASVSPSPSPTAEVTPPAASPEAAAPAVITPSGTTTP